jgi:hypothetical protein
MIDVHVRIMTLHNKGIFWKPHSLKTPFQLRGKFGRMP